MAELQLTNVIDISVSEAGAGAGDYNTSNIALFSHEAYDASSFGTDGYKIYLSPKEVGTDFGTDSDTYAQANAVFSQQPNILAGNGYLVIIPINPQIDDLALSGIPAAGAFVINLPGGASASIAWNDSASSIQTKLRAITGNAGVTVTGSLASQDLKIHRIGSYGVVAAPTVSSNTLVTSGPVGITFTITVGTAAELLGAAIARTEDLVQYFGIFADFIVGQADMLAAAAVVQALNKMIFFVCRDTATVETAGQLDLLRSGSFTQSRGLFYGADNDTDSLVMMASYAGRGLSTNFSGSNTTQTMNMKDLHGVQPDPSMTQTLYVKCKAAGADIYASFQGVSKVVSFGANSFFDQVYNLQWFVGALQIAGFNFLATSSTKIPQTENGISALKSAYRAVCEQGITCQYGAPGTWTSSTTFGNQADFLANIIQRGYYIYSVPVSQQSPTDRAARKAPLVQIAFKEAGAVHSSSVIVNINA